MSKKSAVPDAWDDDWVNAADVRHYLRMQDSEGVILTVTQKPETITPQPAPKLTKSERKAQHQELQKQLWDTAENPGRNIWLETQGVVPLKQELKPQMTLLSRKPAPRLAKKAGGLGAGIADLSVQDDEGDDSEEEARKRREVEFEERQRRTKVEREEKQRKYAEARERIMGSSGPGSPAQATASRESSQGRDTRKPRPRVNGSKVSRPVSADQSPAPPLALGTPSGGLLFDPDDMGRRIPKPNTPTLNGPARQPRGPDASGRGGFGFGGRGG